MHFDVVEAGVKFLREGGYVHHVKWMAVPLKFETLNGYRFLEMN
jgi:hypothetical protein